MNTARSGGPPSTAVKPGPGASGAASKQATRRARTAVLGAGIGTFIEWYDFIAYAFLATVMAQLFFPSESAAVGLLSTFAAFGISFVVRPLGGVILGAIADRRGRRFALTIAVVGMAAASFLIGLLPSAAAIGVAAPALLVLLRVIQGLSAGGESVSAASYLIEEAPDGRRGFFTNFVNVGVIGGMFTASLLVSILRLVVDAHALFDWAWRIPFLLSLPMGVAAVIIRKLMDESRAFEHLKTEGIVQRAPIREAFRREGRGITVTALLTLSIQAGYYLIFTYSASYLQTQGLMSGTGASWAIVLALGLTAATLPCWSRLSDRFGRRPVQIATNLGFIVLLLPMYLLMTVSPGWAVLALVVLGQVCSVSLSAQWVTLTELFPATLRATGLGIGYNLATIIGGTTPFVATWLLSVTGRPQSSALYVSVLAAVSLLTAVFLLKETGRSPLRED
ncbi:MFS transporter [Amycolatopsis sp. NPDC051903]|uniref:MFS transporter n=1 Tax=Amycolatopsis sp. NPDC051903 TaxID=3363936 RepID=UPI0037BC31C9